MKLECFPIDPSATPHLLDLHLTCIWNQVSDDGFRWGVYITSISASLELYTEHNPIARPDRMMDGNPPSRGTL